MLQRVVSNYDLRFTAYRDVLRIFLRITIYDILIIYLKFLKVRSLIPRFYS